MLQKDPEHRLSAEEYLVKQRGKAFPDVFYTSMKIYQQQYVDTIYPPDDKILLWALQDKFIANWLMNKECIMPWYSFMCITTLLFLFTDKSMFVILRSFGMRI